jgi:two-component system response regulator GlrR
MSSGKILVVDDDRNLAEVVRMRLESEQYEVTTAQSEDTALEAVKEKAFDLAIIDLQLDEDGDGISLMEDVHRVNPDMPVIIFTAFGSIESAVEAMKKGAYSYLAKPFEHEKLLFQVEKALEKHQLLAKIKNLTGLLNEKYSVENIVARSKNMQEILRQVALVAKTDSTIYIYGESGTGKELIAKTLHLASDRKDKSFVAINCAAIPETLLESELFGYEKGSFTGASQSRSGLFMQADGGTLFLDEIACMSPALQAKMLRVLQDQQFYSVGGKTPFKVDIRVIVATNKDLKKAVEEGLFREDLFYRICVIPINLPPLRERKEDILPLVNEFIKQFSQKMKKEVKGITSPGMQKLMLHDWPGNIRELENTIEYAVAMTQQDVITEDLILPSNGSSEETLKSLTRAKAEFEKGYVIHLLQVTKGNISRAAELAGRFRADFYNILKKHKVNAADFKSQS